MTDQKKKWQRFTGIFLVLALLCAGVALVACRLQETQTGKDAQDALTASELKIAHYETQLKQLTTQLSDMEQKYYGIQLDYTEQIGALTQELETLRASTTPTQPDKEPSAPSGNTEKPSGQEEQPDTKPSTDKDADDTSRKTEQKPGGDGEMRTDAPEEQELYTRSYYTYYLKNGYAIITAYHGKDESVAVPAAVDGHVVIGLADRAFAGSSVRSVTLPETIESIGWFTFYECKSLERVILPSKLSSIGYASFDGCPQTLCLYVRDGSYAEQFAGSFGLRFERIAY